MFSFPTHTSVLSLHGALGCPRFRVGAVPSLPGCAPTGMGTVGMALGEWILQQPEGEAGSCPTEMCGRDWGEKLLPCLVPSSVALASPRALPPQPGTAVGFCFPAPEEETQHLHWIHHHFHTTVPKTPTEFPPSLVRVG